MGNTSTSYQVIAGRRHKKDSPEAARESIDNWSSIDPVYKRIAEGIRDELRYRDSRRGEDSCIAHSITT